jgi:hypothetical protein
MRALFPRKVQNLELIVRLLDRAKTLRFEQERVAAELKELTESLSRLLPHPAKAAEMPLPGSVDFLPERIVQQEPVSKEVTVGAKQLKAKKAQIPAATADKGKTARKRQKAKSKVVTKKAKAKPKAAMKKEAAKSRD